MLVGMLTGSVGQLNGPPTQVNATGLSNIEKVPIGWEGRHDIGQRAAMTATVLQFCASVFFFFRQWCVANALHQFSFQASWKLRSLSRRCEIPVKLGPFNYARSSRWVCAVPLAHHVMDSIGIAGRPENRCAAYRLAGRVHSTGRTTREN